MVKIELENKKIGKKEILLQYLKEKAIDLLFGDTIDEPTKLRMIANAGEVSNQKNHLLMKKIPKKKCR